MEPADVSPIVDLIARAMNGAAAEQARETFRFHFACRAQNLDDGRTYYVLLLDGAVAGITGLHRYLWGPPENVWLAWFALDPKWQGRGYGKMLLEEMQRLAANQGYTRMFIETYSTSDFDRARTFYRAQGFHEAGHVSGYLPGGGDMNIFVKSLTPLV